MEKTKKVLMITSLSALAVACIMLILAVFKLPIFQGVALRILLVVSTTAISCALAINEVSIIKRKRTLGFVGLALLGLSVLFALIIFCSKLLETYSVFNQITGIISISSVLFIFIISIYSKLEKSMLGLQIPTYICLILLDIMLSILIAGVNIFEIAGISQAFIVLIIISVGLLIASSVISSKRKVSTGSKQASQMITISKIEYDLLKKENEELKKELESLKNKQQN
ncbi:MAG: hypothetical protein ACI4TI_00550 [Christensenellales bacterium]